MVVSLKLESSRPVYNYIKCFSCLIKSCYDFKGVNAAKTGVLTFMVGGKEAGFEEAKPILEQMGKNVIHTGQVGTGQVIKFVHCL